MGEPVEIELIAVVLGLFLLPKILERWFIPGAITAFILGMGYRFLDLSLTGDVTIGFMAILGISSLFLLAGIEVEIEAMRKVWKNLLAHLAMRTVMIAGISLLGVAALGLSIPVAVLIAIALLTPSAGFILDGLKDLPLSDEQRFWVKTKAIASELYALALMFVVMQSGSWQGLLIASGGLAAVIAFLPLVIHLFARLIAPHARNAEFSFIILLAVIVGLATKKLGTYYLLGAFIVGLTVQRFEHLIPVRNLRRIFSALKFFCAFFIPFYFFRAGAGVAASDLKLQSLLIAGIMVGVILPMRVGSIVLERRWDFKENLRRSLPIALSLTPTLVFGLVIAGILKTDYGLAPDIYGALIIYTIAATVIPGFMLRNARFQDVHEPEDELLAAGGGGSSAIPAPDARV